RVGFMDILANAGGPTRFADTRQIKIMRADGSAELVDLARLTAGGGARELPAMSPGDAIFVPEKADDEDSSWLQVAPTRAIYVMGAVQRPGRYEWSSEMSILDLIAHAGGPTSRADVNSVTVVPKNSGDGIVQASLGTGEAKPIVFNLGKFLETGGQTALPELRAGFTIMVPELPDDPSDNKAQWMRQSSDRSIYVLGAVRAPGRYAFDEDFHFLDILSATDGPTSDADLRSVRVTHRNGSSTAVSKVNLAMFFQTGDETLLPIVKPGDVIYFPNRVSGDWLDASKESTVRVLGAVAKPGRYKFDDTMTILDLLAEAGGPTSNAYQERIVVVNLSCCKDQAQTFDLVDFAKSGDFTSLPVLRTGDTVYIPDQSQNEWKIFMDGVRDVVQILSVLALAGVL
ncbi:MAG: SLBB domain-containing protein, partial [Pseudomonadota bacterium]